MELGPEPMDGGKEKMSNDDDFSGCFAAGIWLLFIVGFIGYQLIKFVIGLF